MKRDITIVNFMKRLRSSMVFCDKDNFLAHRLCELLLDGVIQVAPPTRRSTITFSSVTQTFGINVANLGEDNSLISER